MRTGALNLARGALLAGPLVLAFFSGGYFDEPRAWAGLAAWVLVVVAALAEPRAFPRRPASWLAIGGLIAFAGWTLLSITWAPVAGSAYHAGQLAMLYVGGFLAAAMLLRDPASLRAVEPALAAGTLIVIGYGLSERLLPGLLHFHRSISAQGRLEQPLTYWNAMGEFAALGIVLCARVAGDASRQAPLRAVAAGAAAPLGMGLYLSFSRGALFACCAGLVALIVAAPRREQLRAALLALLGAALAAVSCAPFHGVTSLAGTASLRERQGAITFALLVVVACGAALAQCHAARRERTAELRLPRRAPLLALIVICAGLALAIVVGAKESSSRPLSAGATRYGTLQSNRYAYWRVALKAFEAEPLHGVGAGGWAVWWLRDRTIPDFAQDAHSLPLQTLAELGVVGEILLLVFIAGVGWAAWGALKTVRGLAAGAAAAFVAWLAHQPLDWDWQMPALTLVAIALAGAIVAAAELQRDDRIRVEATAHAPTAAQAR